MMWGNGFGWGGPGWGSFGMVGMLFGGLMMVVFWGGLIALGFVAVRALTQPPRDRPLFSQSENRALDILKERYARGEVTKEQYEDMRRDLS